MTVRDYIFLYCYLIYGQQNEEILAVLAPERAERIRAELRKFDRFPKEVRLSLVLKLLGYMVQHVRNRNIEMIHPTWIYEALKRESPAIVSRILARFTPDYRSQIYEYLGWPADTVDPRKSGPVDDSDIVFQVFANRFVSMAAPWGDSELSIRSIYLLAPDDLFTLVREIGMREFALASILAGDDVTAALISRFPEQSRDSLVGAIQDAKNTPESKQKRAARRLADYDLTSMAIEEAILKVGLSTISDALAYDRQLLRKVAQRLPRGAGNWLMESATKQVTSESDAEEIIRVLEDLISRGKIDKQSVQSRFPAPSRTRLSAMS